MKESSKTSKILGDRYFEKYLKGNILDIGSGNDPVCTEAKCFDLNDGDANKIDEYFGKRSFDCVYSSHCLEHMFDPYNCIKKWFSLVKENGYLIIVIPDGELYEQNIFPSIFNKDHKKIFYDQIKEGSSHNIISIKKLISSLNNASVVKYELHDHNYDYNLRLPSSNYKLILPIRIQILMLKLRKTFLRNIVNNILIKLVASGVPIDQTLDIALAQRCIIIQRNK